MSKRWEEEKEPPSPPSPSAVYRSQKHKYLTKLAVIGHQRVNLPPPPSLVSRPSSHPHSTVPITVPPAARPHLRLPVPSSRSLPSPSVPRSSPMDIPTGSRRSSAGMWQWREEEEEDEDAEADGDLVDDSGLVWAGRGEGEVDYGWGWDRKGARSTQRAIGSGEDDEIEPFPLLPPSYCVDFEL